MEAADESVINFRSCRHEYGAFSNFYCARIFIDGKAFPTTEHYFQAMKFAGTVHERAIRSLTTPRQAATAGRDRKKPLRSDWEEAKDDVMRTAVRAKFTQHDDLKELLLSTDDATLVEHTANDRYWGDGGDGSGRNMLGNILMQIRSEIKNGGVMTHIGQDGKQNVHPASIHTSRDSGRLQKIEGDLLDSPCTYIVHQCNCKTTYAKGLAKSLFDKFPHANCYDGEAKTTRRPGDIQICANGPRIIVNLFGQDKPGKPARRGHDSYQTRLVWFNQGLSALLDHLRTLPPSETESTVTIAFPHMVGCGLAWGKWEDYQAAIERFTDACPSVIDAVYIVRLS